MIGQRPCLRLSRASSIAGRPLTCSSFTTYAGAAEAAPSLLLMGLRQLPDNEAHVRVAGQRGGLEDALHDQSRDVLIDLEDDHAGERLAARPLHALPELALALQDVVELVDALHALRLFDRSGGTRGGPVDDEL